ncbi:hypothetical protein [Pectobacterium parmentieri]|uniref:hypothetical protein n=1 Tax=Pectobacterium parmentieri TaxID=1905730 RepID=UPI00047313DF|nr:hypothetical protein [Pectobacterium parmentieri]AYH03963.1 hypothetical protein C5E25_00305 [Pectobacterium parmentieri]MBN3179661.1 hypothetical protein [Pectobacterium parmentieri]
MHAGNVFINNRTKEINNALKNNDSNINELICGVGDLFSSPYKREIIADSDTIQALWDLLFNVLDQSDDNNTKFDAISTMCDIYIYQSNIGLSLSLNKIKQWREDLQTTTSSEILDCIDDILSM